MLATVANAFHNGFSLVIIIGFSLLLGYFWLWVYSKNRVIIKKLTSIDDLDSLPEKVKSKFSNYKDTMINYKEEQKTAESIQKYLNQEFLASLINIRFWLWVPSLFVGMGILGTFYGLQKGITGFDTNTSESIQASIKSLLDGTSTAFISSLCGIFLSLVFHFIEKWKINSLIYTLNSKVRDFDDQYLLKFSEIQEIEANKKLKEQEFVVNAINNKLDKLLTIRDRNGKNLSAINYLENINNGISEQRSAIQEVIDDLYSNLKIEFEKYSNASKDKIDEVITNVVAVNSALGNFSNDTGKEIGDTVSVVIQNLTEQLTSISSDFKETIQEGALKQINDISEMLASTATIMEKTPQNIETTISAIQNSLLDELNKNIGNFSDILKLSMNEYTQSVEKMISKITDSETERQKKQETHLDMSISKFMEREESQAKTIEGLLTTYTEINDEQLSQTSKVMKTSIEDFKKQFSDILSSYKTESSLVMNKNLELIKEIDRVALDTKENTKAIHQDITKISELNIKSINRFKDLINDNEKLLSQFKSQISGLITITTNFKDINEEFSKTTGENSKILEHIKTITETSGEKFREYLESGNKTVELFKNITLAERENITNQVKNYREIHAEVDKVFKRLNDGINEYQKVVETNLNNALSSYINNFDNAISGLHTTVTSLNEALESLEDIVPALVANGDTIA